MLPAVEEQARRGVEAIARVERTRDELGETVQALIAKAGVRARAAVPQPARQIAGRAAGVIRRPEAQRAAAAVVVLRDSWLVPRTRRR